MPIRIYALAKELDIDSKDLVEVCNKAGVTGKGSALASLTDDEVAKVKSHLTKSSSPTSTKPSAGTGSTPAPMVRPTNTGRPIGKIPVIQAKKAAATPIEAAAPLTSEPAATEPTPATAPAPPQAEPPATPAPVEETPVPAAEQPPQPEEAKPVRSSRPPIDVRRGKKSDAAPRPPVARPPAERQSASRPPAARPPAARPPAAKSKPQHPNRVGFTRDDYIAPGGSGGKPPVLGRPKSTGDSESKGGGAGKGGAKKVPGVRLANIPQSGGSTPKPTSGGGKTQKPIMTLSPDAISRAKKGGGAPLEQFTKSADKKKRGGGGATSGPGAMPVSPADLIPAGEGKGGRRRGGGKSDRDGEKGEDGNKKLAGMASARAARSSNTRRRGRLRQDDDDSPRRGRRRLQRKGGTNTAAPRKGRVTVELPCTIRSLSEASGVATAQIQRALMGMGMMVTINAELDDETTELVATELDLEVDFKQPETLEDTLLTKFEEMTDDPADLVTRPPIITFLGHVDHGKTSLLDRIIGINVVDREAGGITQHIRAYRINKDGRAIAFVDTPGHEAFTEMRARGANVTDIAVLVVAADDGVMPQTEEAISHAKAAGVPIVVALNKIDLPGADENKAFQDLSTHGLLPTEWGGDVEVVKTSATTGEGVDDLLETLLLTAEIHEYTANPKREANGICLESQQDGDKGVVAKLIVTNGTLRVGDVVVCGSCYGKVKAMHDTLKPKKKLGQAGPSTPVSVIGLDMAPEAGDPFYVMDDVSDARVIAEQRKGRQRSQSLSGATVRVSFEEFQRRLQDGSLGSQEEVTSLNIILRADVRGSIEAIQKELEKLDHPEVKVNILQATVGGVTSADVTLADASDAVIVGFNVIPDEAARELAEERGVEIRRYDIIYKVTEDLKAMLSGKLKPEERVTDLGRALVQRLFTISRLGTIAGCRVLAGKIERGCRMRVNRDGRGIGDYPLDSLRREKDDTKEVREGFECGIKLSGFNDLKEGDILEAYKIEEVARSL